MTEQAQLNNEVRALLEISNKPSLVALSYSLRHPETWPQDFVWDYSSCATCAVGLALRLWPETLVLPDTQRMQITWIAREMALPWREAEMIFFELAPIQTARVGWFKSVESFNFDAVTPDDVADAIDRHLAEQMS